MEFASNRKITALSLGVGLTSSELKVSREIYARIIEEVHNGQHQGRTCYYGGLMSKVPTLEEVATRYNLPLDRARFSSAENCMIPSYTNVLYFFPKGKEKPLFWYVEK